MSRTFRILYPADIEIRSTTKEYNMLRPGLGEKIIAELDERFEHIKTFPESYQKIGRYFRSVELDRIPFKLYYAVSEEEITVVGFVPSRADPKKQLNIIKQRYSLLSGD